MTKQDLRNDLKTAMMAKEELKVSTLRMLLSAIQTVETQSEKHEASEEEMMSVVSREVKRHKEAIEEYQKANRPELAQKEQSELAILESYLPAQLSSDEVATIVKAGIATAGATSADDFGKVMKEVSPKVKGKADGKIVSDLVKQLLG